MQLPILSELIKCYPFSSSCVFYRFENQTAAITQDGFSFFGSSFIVHASSPFWPPNLHNSNNCFKKFAMKVAKVSKKKYRNICPVKMLIQMNSWLLGGC